MRIQILETLALNIKKLKHDGIQNWGQEHKLQPVAFGIKKLIISLVVFDDLIGVDDITDMLMDKYEDDIQSIDIGAFSKFNFIVRFNQIKYIHHPFIVCSLRLILFFVF